MENESVQQLPTLREEDEIHREISCDVGVNKVLCLSGVVQLQAANVAVLFVAIGPRI